MARFSLRALLVAALCAAPPPTDAAAGNCTPLRHSARSEAGTLHLPAAPNQWYRGWLIEGGRELRLRDGDLSLGAAPARYARLPLWLQADQEGAVTLDIEAASGPAHSELNIELDCSHADARLPATLQQISRLAARHAEHPDPALGWRLAWRLFTTHHRHPDDSELRLWLLQQQLGLAQRAGLMEQAAGWAEQLAQFSGSLGRESERGVALLNLAGALLTLDLARSEMATEEARSIFKALAMDYYEAIAHHEQCLQRRLRGDVQEPIVCYEAVARRMAALGEHEEQITAQTNLVVALFRAGRYADGRALLEKSTALAIRHGTAPHRARLALLESQLATWRADIDAALALLFTAREVFEGDHDPRGVAQVDRLLGHRYTLAGEPGRALSYYQQSRKVLNDFGLQRSAIQLLLHESRAHELLGDLEQALALAAEAEARMRKSINRHEWRNAALSLASLHVRHGHYKAAMELIAALDSPLTAPQERQRGRLMTEIGDPAGADESTLQQWVEADLAEGRLVEALLSGALLVGRYVESGRDAEALSLIDRIQRNVQPALRGLRTPAVREALLRQLQALHAQRTLAWTTGPVDEDDAAALVADLDALAPTMALRTHDDDRLVELERRIGDDLLGADPQSTPMHRDRSLLDIQFPASTPDSANHPTPSWNFRHQGMLVYPVMRRDSGGFLIHDASGWRWLMIDLRALRRARKLLHQHLAAGHASGEALDEAAANVRSALNVDQWLLGQHPIWILAHADLAGLPLEWLRSVDGKPSGSLAWLRLATPGEIQRPRQLALIGAAAGGNSPLANLAEVAPELAEVRKAWSDLPASPVATTSAGLLEALADPGALVHVAAHGRSAAAREEEAGLWLQELGGAPAFVSALRLRRSPVRAALVVLSACDSGYSPAGARLGFGGVAASVIEAGADAVVATRWPVGDRTARRFSAQFHAALEEAPTAPEKALQRATQALRSQPATRHPTHWAGWFVLRRAAPNAGNSLADATMAAP